MKICGQSNAGIKDAKRTAEEWNVCLSGRGDKDLETYMRVMGR